MIIILVFIIVNILLCIIYFIIMYYINKEINVDMSLRNKCYYFLGNCCWSLLYISFKFILYKLICILRFIKFIKV